MTARDGYVNFSAALTERHKTRLRVRSLLNPVGGASAQDAEAAAKRCEKIVLFCLTTSWCANKLTAVNALTPYGLMSQKSRREIRWQKR